MKKIKEKKFTLEKFEIAKLKNLSEILGGTGNNDAVNETGTLNSTRCSTTPRCKDIVVIGPPPPPPHSVMC